MTSAWQSLCGLPRTHIRWAFPFKISMRLLRHDIVVIIHRTSSCGSKSCPLTRSITFAWLGSIPPWFPAKRITSVKHKKRKCVLVIVRYQREAPTRFISVYVTIRRSAGRTRAKYSARKWVTGSLFSCMAINMSRKSSLTERVSLLAAERHIRAAHMANGSRDITGSLWMSTVKAERPV